MKVTLPEATIEAVKPNETSVKVPRLPSNCWSVSEGRAEERDRHGLVNEAVSGGGHARGRRPTRPPRTATRARITRADGANHSQTILHGK